MSNSNTSNNIKALAILIAMLVLCFGFGWWCKSSQTTEPLLTTSKSDTTYLKDTSRHSEVHNHFHITNAYTVTPEGKKIDTSEIIRNYFTKRFVTDTIKDSLLIYAISDTLFNNKITNRKTSYKLVKPYQTVITNTTSTYIPLSVSQVGFYAGGFIGFNKSFIQTAGVEANLVTDKINYGLGYDFKNDAVTAKVLVRIGKTKREKQLIDLLKLKPVK